MQPIRFIHAAGFRLDSPYSGLRDPSAAVDERLRAAPFEAFRNLQALCEAEAPDFLLIAGGVFELADRSIHAQLAFRDGLAAIVGAGVPVYLAHGPTDPAAAWLPTIDWPEGVHVMGGRPDWYPIVRDGETIALLQGASQLSGTLHGPSAAEFETSSDGDVFTVGLVGQITAANDDEPDPLDSLPVLHYWALGPEQDGALQSDPSRRIVTTGPTQALSPAESGPHGCYVVKCDEAGRAGPDFVALDSVRWDSVTVDISNLTPDELIPIARRAALDALAGSDGRDLVCRLALTGNAPADFPDIDHLLKGLRDSVHFDRPWVWIDRIENLTTTTLDPPAPGSTPLLTALHTRFASLAEDSAPRELVSSVSSGMPSGPLNADADDDDPGEMARLLRDARDIAVQRLSPGRSGRS